MVEDGRKAAAAAEGFDEEGDLVAPAGLLGFGGSSLGRILLDAEGVEALLEGGEAVGRSRSLPALTSVDAALPALA